jgi:signal transduction histidine kinase
VSRRPSWLRGPYALDVLIAVALAAFSLIVFVTSEPAPEAPRDADPFGALLILVGTGSLAFRRRWPVAVFAVASAATITMYLLGYADSGLPVTVVIALYTLASRVERWITVVATSALLVATPIMFVVADRKRVDTGTIVGTMAVFTMSAVLGDRKQVRDAYLEQLSLRAAEKDRERIEAAQRAVAEERLRIARELHDVVAHAMSVVAVQSGVGVHVIDTRPDEAKRMLVTISETSRDSLSEMRRMLGVLRADPTLPAEDLTPAPGLSRVGELVERVTEAGVPVDLVVTGERNGIPPGVDLAAYRIVQEALTNVLKHAGRTRVNVAVRYEPQAVHVEVVDDGRGAGAAPADRIGGHGLVGMRERAAMYDGVLAAGPRPGGGYRVAATLRFFPLGSR